MANMLLINDLCGEIKMPERVVLTDNGAYDLERSGVRGYYTWVGYKHKGWKSEPKMNQLIAQVAQEVASYLSSKYAGKAVVEDYINIFDAYRVYIQLN